MLNRFPEYTADYIAGIMSLRKPLVKHYILTVNFSIAIPHTLQDSLSSNKFIST